MLVLKLAKPSIPVKKIDEARFDSLDCQIRAFHGSCKKVFDRWWASWAGFPTSD